MKYACWTNTMLGHQRGGVLPNPSTPTWELYNQQADSVQISEEHPAIPVHSLESQSYHIVLLPVHSVATHLVHLSKDHQACAARASTHHLIIPFLDGSGLGQIVPISLSGNIFLARATRDIHILPRRCCSTSNWMQSSQGLPFLHYYPRSWWVFLK